MKKSSFSTYELIGIVASTMIMAALLVFISPESNSSRTEDVDGAEGPLVVSNDTHGTAQNTLASALVEAAPGGSLSRLVIKDIRIGTGTPASKGDRVTVHYIGSTEDGVQFDNSYEQGRPFSFTLGSGTVITGWEEGVLGMKKGGQRILVIPPKMGYGDRQVGPIAPNSVLIFAVELLSVE